MASLIAAVLSGPGPPVLTKSVLDFYTNLPFLERTVEASIFLSQLFSGRDIQTFQAPLKGKR